MRAIDIAGNRFGMLVAVRRAPSDAHGQARWVCLCDCGGESVVNATTLRTGHTKSCGCQRNTGKQRLRHGHAKHQARTTEYRIWCGMHTRCGNPRERSYPDYGGRGITVCERWNVFEDFLADMGPRPSLGHSIDRKDNDRGYEPDNCRWATRLEQAQNRRPRRDAVAAQPSGEAHA